MIYLGSERSITQSFNSHGYAEDYSGAHLSPIKLNGSAKVIKVVNKYKCHEDSINYNDFLNNRSALTLIENIINSKMLFLTNNGFVALGDFLQDEKDIYYSNDSYKDYISIFTSSYLNDYKTYSKYTSKYIYYDNYITEITLNKKDVEMLKHKYFIDKKINDQIYISSDGLVLKKVNSYKYKYDDEFCSYVELEDFAGVSCIVGGAIYDC